MPTVMMTKDPEVAQIFRDTMDRLNHIGDMQLGDMMREAEIVTYDLNPSMTVRESIRTGTEEQVEIIRNAIAHIFKH